MTGAPNARLAERPPPPLALPDNGDLSRGLDGWGSLGRDPLQVVATPAGPAVRLIRNATLLSPAFTVPPGAQAVGVVARAPGGGALLEVVARAADGGPDVPLGTLEPGRARAVHHVSLAGLAGRTVRLALDPVPALGRSVEIGGVGPLAVLVPRWELRSGLALPVRAGGRRALRVDEGAAVLTSERFPTGPGARALLVAVRGDGRVAAQAGGRGAAVRASGRWRDLRVPLPRGARSVRLTIAARAGQGPVEVADLGIVLRASALARPAVVRRGTLVRIRGRVVPAGAGMQVELRLPSGRLLARVRSDRDGRYALRARTAAPSAVLIAVGDRTRLPARRAVELPPLR